MARMPLLSLRSGSQNPFEGIDVGDDSAPTFHDIDADGDMDLILGDRTGGLSYFENTSTGFVERSGAANPFSGIDVGTDSTVTFSDVDGDGDSDMLVGARDGSLNYFENTGSGFSQRVGLANPFEGLLAASSGPQSGFSSAPVFVDLDGDGDPDLFVGEGVGDYAPTEPFKYFERTASGYVERTGTSNPFNGLSSYSGQSSIPSFADVDGDGDLDLLRGTERYVEPLFGNFGRLYYYENTGTGFDELTYAEIRIEGFSSTQHTGPAPAFFDGDGDGDVDLVLGISNGTLLYFENQAPVVRNGTPNNDTLTGAATDDTLSGFGGHDLLIGLAGADTLDGGSGTDTTSYAASNAGVTVRLHNGTANGGHAEGDRLSQIENVVGSQFADLLIGDAGANALNGLAGDDILSGLAGPDTLTGGAGADVFLFVAEQGRGDVVTDYSNGDLLYFAEHPGSLAFTTSNTSVNIGGVELRNGTSQDTVAIWSAASARTDVARATLADDGSVDLTALSALNLDLTVAIFDTDNNSAFRSIVHDLQADGNSRLTTITYDSGYVSREWTDTGDLTSWTTSITGYTAAGRADYVTTVYDSGVVKTTDYDQDQNLIWSTKITQTGGSLARDNFVRVNFDSGQWEITYSDVGGLEPWTSRTNGYTANNKHVFTVLYNNDGTRTRTEYDRDNTDSYSIREAKYDANGDIFYQTTVYDDGSRTARSFDNADAYAWEEQIAFYDTQGRADLLRRDYDDGGYAVRDFDQNNEHAWHTWVREFDDNNMLISEEFLY